MMFAIEGRNTQKENFIVQNIIISLVMAYVLFNLLNMYVLNGGFHPTDAFVKPFILFPLFFLLITVLSKLAPYAWNMIKVISYFTAEKWRAHAVVYFLLLGTLITYVFYTFMNIHIWSITFNPIDFILKPFMIVPISLLLLKIVSSSINHLITLPLFKPVDIAPKLTGRSLLIRNKMKEGESNYISEIIRLKGREQLLSTRNRKSVIKNISITFYIHFSNEKRMINLIGKGVVSIRGPTHMSSLLGVKTHGKLLDSVLYFTHAEIVN
ncbi:hypothetical protein QA612_11060 [Evansella sp. AB-P1]|uniref:hypothetical protein n=1 Tax=Evansella sp. AB-P1 TaxID=3037653 RepID=UPI00241D3CC5|nr:hypothetical protein [Evansella sp. AB-P1]MDG5788029.1 hypothetical protein [Evansella sp. AB-P1]